MCSAERCRERHVFRPWSTSIALLAWAERLPLHWLTCGLDDRSVPLGVAEWLIISVAVNNAVVIYCCKML